MTESMTEDCIEDWMDDALGRVGTASRHSLHRGRAVIAMAAVRSGMRGPPGTVFGPFKLRPPTDATQWRPCPRQRDREQRETGDRVVSWGVSFRFGWWEIGPQSSMRSSALCHRLSPLLHLLKHRLQFRVGQRAVPKEEAGDFTVEGFLAGMLNRVAFLTNR